MDSNEDKKVGTGLDLGLAELLEPEVEAESSSVSLDEEQSLPNSLNDRKSAIFLEWRGILEESGWKGVVEIAEEKMGGESSEDPIIRLWWLRGQTSLNSLPISMLAAPLEGLLARTGVQELIESDQEFKSLLIETLEQVSIKLGEKKDRVLSIRFLEKAYRLNPDLGEKLFSLVKEELESLDPLHLKHSRDPRLTKQFRELRELERELFLHYGGKEEVSVEPVVPGKKDKKKSGFSLYLLLFLVLVAGGIYKEDSLPFWKKIFMTASEFEADIKDLTAYDEELTLGSLRAELRIPELKKVNIQRESGLNDILKALDNAEEAPQGEEKLVSSESADAEVNKEREIVTVNTLQPVEPKELTELIEDRYQDLVRENEPQRLTEEELLNSAVTTVQKRSDTIVPGQRIASYRNLRRDARVRGVGLFRVISETKVFEKPTVDSEILATLFVGTEVVVAEEMGRWLRIVSDRRREGFILAEMVDPALR